MKTFAKLVLAVLVCFAAVWGVATIAEKNMTPRETVLEQRVAELEDLYRKQQEQIDDIMSVQGYQIWKERKMQDEWEG